MCVPQSWLSPGLIVIFCGAEGSEESRWHMPCCGHKNLQLFLCLPVQAFPIIVQHTQASDGTTGPQEHWSGTALVLVQLCQVLTVRARWKPLMTARWLAAGL